MRIGVIGQCSNKGLGNMTWEFYKHIRPAKVLIIKNRFTAHLERMPDAIVTETRPSKAFLTGFLKGLDIVVTFENPHNPDLFKIAKEMGVKSVMVPMFEFLDERWDKPDLYICPSKLDYDTAIGNKIHLPWPVNDKVLKRRKPKQAMEFLYNRGGGGTKNRNSYDEMVEATRITKSNARFIINSQGKNDRKNYWEMWEQGDVFVFPHKFGGLSLPVQEAMATGLPIITLDFYPFNEFIPKELLMKPDKKTVECISRKLTFYHVSPQTIADKIDEVANWPSEKIQRLSDQMYNYSQAITWTRLLPKYLQIFKELL